MEWHQRAKSIARERGVTLKELAGELKVGTAAAGHYLSGRNEPSIPQLKQIAAHLGLSVSELIGDQASGLSSDERQLVDAYRDMPAETRSALLHLAMAQKKSR